MNLLNISSDYNYSIAIDFRTKPLVSLSIELLSEGGHEISLTLSNGEKILLSDPHCVVLDLFQSWEKDNPVDAHPATVHRRQPEARSCL